MKICFGFGNHLFIWTNIWNEMKNILNSNIILLLFFAIIVIDFWHGALSWKTTFSFSFQIFPISFSKEPITNRLTSDIIKVWTHAISIHHQPNHIASFIYVLWTTVEFGRSECSASSVFVRERLKEHPSFLTICLDGGK